MDYETEYDQYDDDNDFEEDLYNSESVSKDDWISDNQNRLHYIYSFIMNFCKTTGFRYFDLCTFPQFCDLAWQFSSGYTRGDRYKYL